VWRRKGTIAQKYKIGDSRVLMKEKRFAEEEEHAREEILERIRIRMEKAGSSESRVKKIPKEMEDLAIIVKKECKTFDELQRKIEAIKPPIVWERPYSRLAAIIIHAPKAPTLADVCEGKAEREFVEGAMAYLRLRNLSDKCSKALVEIYRGDKDIRAGDFVHLEYGYAAVFGKVHSLTVPKRDIVFAYTLTEWFYIPYHLVGYFKSLEDFWDSIRS